MTKKVLVITDAQNEFITGALGNKECEAAVKNIVAAAKSGEYYKVIITKDTHTADYLDTQEGKRLPVLHGQEGTEGYKIHPDIVKAVQEHYAPENVITVKKPTFGSPEFGKLLKTIWEEVVAAGEAGIDIAACGGILRVTEIQMPGKKRVEVKEYLKGNSIEIGTVLG